MAMRNFMDKPYNVPVIAPDLRKEETIHQICDALTYLDQVAKDAFSRISARVQENQQRLKVHFELLICFKTQKFQSCAHSIVVELFTSIRVVTGSNITQTNSAL